MNRNILLLSMFIVFSGCVKEEIIYECEAPIEGKWMLTKVFIGWSETELTGEDIGYEEYYIFNSDGSFSKTNISEEGSKSVNGIYSEIETTDGNQLKLEYPEDHELIENCTGDPIEVLTILTNELKGGSAPCDGPDLYYTPE
ncbi:hypothetical protein [Mangrovivirga cuniculi]|uniref:Lipocalin-like domain-containing protein n=1 Tax=Mangrovivirga cuniculi TaxID=2715131 RepID=A0A4D7JMK2_9BACT|nr:hypothetical protein [Mangrovivirga cuniculi]QCK16831.1 hypothetical protein DCC35_19875 [Mangrovivirga cuniculi]